MDRFRDLRDYRIVFQFDINGNFYYRIYFKDNLVYVDDDLKSLLFSEISVLLKKNVKYD